MIISLEQSSAIDLLTIQKKNHLASARGKNKLAQYGGGNDDSLSVWIEAAVIELAMVESRLDCHLGIDTQFDGLFHNKI